jgi:hypothetical protein
MDSDSVTARQCSLRLYQPLPVIVRGVDARGEAFEVHTVLESISTGDLSVRLRQRVELGVRLFTVVHFLGSSEELGSGARVDARGGGAHGALTRRGVGYHDDLHAPPLSPAPGLKGVARRERSDVDLRVAVRGWCERHCGQTVRGGYLDLRHCFLCRVGSKAECGRVGYCLFASGKGVSSVRRSHVPE